MDENTFDKETEEAKKQAVHFGLNFVSLRSVEIPYEILSIIPEDVARRNDMIIYDKKDNHIYIAVANPERLKQKAPEILSTLKKEKGYSFTIAITTPNDLNYALLGYKQAGNQANVSVNQNQDTDQDEEISFVDLKALGSIPKSVLNKLPEKIATKYRLVVFAQNEDEGSIDVAMENPDNLQSKQILDFIKERNNIAINEYKTTSEGIDWALSLYENIEGVELDKKEIDTMSEDAKQEEKKFEQQKKEQIQKDIAQSEAKELQEKAKEEEEPAEFFQEKKDEEKEVEAKPIEPAQEIKKVKEESQKESEKVDLDVYKPQAQKEQENALTLTGDSEDAGNNLDQYIPTGLDKIEDLRAIINQASIPKIVAAIIILGVKKKASDIHIEVEEKIGKLRYRLDGVLVNIADIPYTLHAPIVSRIKILAKLKIDEQRIPQDGRFGIVADKKNIDLRVSTLPTVHGEKCVMRILDKSTGIVELEKLGLNGINLEKAKRAISKPYGIIFVTGPTGSGKTTTLYAMLSALNKPEVNIVTLEDPVEYELPGVNQCQIKPNIGFGFAEGLRSILRQDPNIIMVGEVRDTETANMATHAALTGHLVLSTLHTNDSTGALPRLIDMGVEPFLITSSINAIIAQRLVRKLCDDCKQKAIVPDKILQSVKETLKLSGDPEIKQLADKELTFYKPKGCAKCKDGYIGRIGLYETLEMNERIEQLVVNRSTASTIRRAAINQGLVTLLQDGYAKAALGQTSLDEIIRVTKR